jgi:pimeloyl-ACP methyl ester carboxylesterase
VTPVGNADVVREHPLFVPYRSSHLAAVLTFPVRDPRGLVLLLTGLAATRSHRFGMWTGAARRLAKERGLASLRLDYAGTGDSTRYAARWTEDSRAQVDVAVDLGLRATGASAFAAVGNCLGGRHALELAAARPGCVGAVCIRPELAPMDDLVALARRSGTRRLLGLGRGDAAGRSAVDPRMADLLAAAAGKRILFLYGEVGGRDVDAARPTLDALVRRVPTTTGGRLEIRVVPGVSLVGFRTLEAQRATVDAVVGWMGALFPPPSASSTLIQDDAGV